MKLLLIPEVRVFVAAAVPLDGEACAVAFADPVI
jgi:hypothetical protein